MLGVPGSRTFLRVSKLLCVLCANALTLQGVKQKPRTHRDPGNEQWSPQGLRQSVIEASYLTAFEVVPTKERDTTRRCEKKGLSRVGRGETLLRDLVSRQKVTECHMPCWPSDVRLYTAGPLSQQPPTSSISVFHVYPSPVSILGRFIFLSFQGIKNRKGTSVDTRHAQKDTLHSMFNYGDPETFFPERRPAAGLQTGIRRESCCAGGPGRPSGHPAGPQAEGGARSWPGGGGPESCP